MHFIVDAQLPPALAVWIAGKGHSASHVVDVGLERATDDVIWKHASAAHGVIVPKDEDFARRKAQHQGGPSVVWIRFGNTTRPDLLARFNVHWPATLEALIRGEGLIELN